METRCVRRRRHLCTDAAEAAVVAAAATDGDGDIE